LTTLTVAAAAVFNDQFTDEANAVAAESKKHIMQLISIF
jgi:hypothetical protein